MDQEKEAKKLQESLIGLKENFAQLEELSRVVSFTDYYLGEILTVYERALDYIGKKVGEGYWQKSYGNFKCSVCGKPPLLKMELGVNEKNEQTTYYVSERSRYCPYCGTQLIGGERHG